MRYYTGKHNKIARERMGLTFNENTKGSMADATIEPFTYSFFYLQVRFANLKLIIFDKSLGDIST